MFGNKLFLHKHKASKLYELKNKWEIGRWNTYLWTDLLLQPIGLIQKYHGLAIKRNPDDIKKINPAARSIFHLFLKIADANMDKELRLKGNYIFNWPELL